MPATDFKRALLFTLLVIGFLSSDRLAAEKPKAVKPPASQDESWVYHSKEHGFSIRLPTKRWREIGKGKTVVAFANPWPSRMTAAVLSVKKQSQDEFRQTIDLARRVLKKNEAGLLQKPEVVEQTTKHGDQRWCIIVKEKGQNGSRYILVGLSYTWIKARGITVEMLFEGLGQARSKLFQSYEKEAFEKSLKPICLSVE